MDRKHLYSYRGPVTAFGKIITPNWHGTTYAVSKSKAKSNLVFRFKKETNRIAGARIELPGEIILVS